MIYKMFELLIENNYVDTIQKNAKNEIKKDRLRFANILEYIVGYVKKSTLIVSSIDILLDRHEYWEDIKIYGDNVDEHARNLMKELCEEFEDLFQLKIREPNKEYIIEYDLRRMCTLTHISMPKNHNIYNFINPIEKDVRLMPSLLELIDMYSMLYNPFHASKWEELYEDIKRVEVYFDKYYTTLTTTNEEELASLISSSSKRKSTETSSHLLRDPLRKLLEDHNYVFLDFDDIYIISSNPPKYDYKIFSDLVSKIMPTGLVYSQVELYSLRDFLLKRYDYYTLKNSGGKVKKEKLITVYNSSSYELIKSREGSAASTIQLKFLYIETWLQIIEQKIKGLNYKKFIKAIKSLYTRICKHRGKINIHDKPREEDYIGIFSDPMIQKKILALSNIGAKNNYYCFEM